MSNTERRALSSATDEVTTTNGNALARVVIVKGRDELRAQTGWASRPAFSSSHKMTRAQATALRDALTAALDA